MNARQMLLELYVEHLQRENAALRAELALEQRLRVLADAIAELAECEQEEST